MRKNNSLFAAWIALAIAVILFSSLMFVAAEADHTCIGDDCRICAQIHCCENLIKCTALSTAAVCLSAAIFRIFASPLFARGIPLENATLIAHKIKLSI